MYELTDELAQYSDADPPVDLTGTRFFKDLSGDIGIILTPLAQYPGVSMPSLLHARLATDRAQGHLSQAFVATLFTIDDERDDSAESHVFVLWDASRGVGTVVVRGEGGAPDTLDDTEADDLTAYLTLVFEQPGPEEIPT
jgi:hypothetical protein